MRGKKQNTEHFTVDCLEIVFFCSVGVEIVSFIWLLWKKLSHVWSTKTFLDVPDHLTPMLTDVSMETALFGIFFVSSSLRTPEPSSSQLFWTVTAAPPHLHPSICREHCNLTARGGWSPVTRSPLTCSGVALNQNEGTTEGPGGGGEVWGRSSDLWAMEGWGRVLQRTVCPENICLFFTFISHQVISTHPSVCLSAAGTSADSAPPTVRLPFLRCSLKVSWF